MLTIYLDDSDADTGAVSTIAGYIADEDGWARFEVAAAQLCQNYGVNVLHCREFDANKGDFKGWSVPRKAGFVIGIRQAMFGNIHFGISRSVPKDRYKAQKAQLQLDHQSGVYGYTFSTIVDELCNGNETPLAARVKGEGVAYKVESGHKNNPELESIINSRLQAGTISAASSIEFVEKDACRAIQIADLYAFYSRRKANKWYKSKGKLQYFPDLHGLHIQPYLNHHTGLIEEPYREATVEKSGMKFQIKGLATPI
ncbi:DUF3800 domain-containing protein [Rhizorhabdus sp. FW153]|uniref:DUF3800 domain-containing protein n=1 Tax=Rhizorhabdus sp. FW153 TaxID=3400216 RepID=UPI003CEF1D29